MTGLCFSYDALISFVSLNAKMLSFEHRCPSDKLLALLEPNEQNLPMQVIDFAFGQTALIGVCPEDGVIRLKYLHPGLHNIFLRFLLPS